MIKELLKYILPLCILLVDGVSNMYAGSQERAGCTAPVQLLAQSQHPHFIQAFDDSQAAFRLPDAARQFAEFVKATLSEEKEEDSNESLSLKKQPHTGTIPVAAFSDRFHFTFHDTLLVPPIDRFGTFAYAPRYLRLRVLRI